MREQICKSLQEGWKKRRATDREPVSVGSGVMCRAGARDFTERGIGVLKMNKV